MKAIDHSQPRTVVELTSLLEQFPESLDPEFDNDYQELEREFAERRLTFGNC
jgi:hypothetical protein